MDQFITEQGHLGKLNEIHADLVISTLETVLRMYPSLNSKQIQLFIEANLSQDLCVYVQLIVKEHFASIMPHLKIGIVKQHDSYGNPMPGVLTRHKENLVYYFKRLLDDGKVFIANQICTVGRLLQVKYRYTKEEHRTRYGIGDLWPTESDMTSVVKVFMQQACDFRCYRRGNSTIYTGKRNRKGTSVVDDLIMAVIIAIAWALLPCNTYVIE